ncbi:MAG: CerR family C-terminal domain-containing protein [Candidatus Hydrogenedentes bacterium]|nr:CerR family C-terminal domain-containing protein [Candidatus Hydrogenedentota bacterium]
MTEASPKKAAKPELDARERLIRAGLEVFAHFSFDGATTRMLASRAGVNLAAIPYYFGSKESLYQAVIQHVIDQIRARSAAELMRVRGRMASGPVTPEEALCLLQDLFTAVSGTMLGTAEAKHWGQLMVREQMEPSSAYELLYDQLLGPMQGLACVLVARVLDRDPNAPEVILRTHALIGQIISFRAARETVCRRLAVKDLSPEQVRHIQGIINEHVAIVLCGLQARPQDGENGQG